MTRYAIKRATPRADFTVAIEWADGSSSKVDFRPEFAPPAGLIDFHADELWQRTHIKPVAAE